jgi:hypothetical protein
VIFATANRLLDPVKGRVMDTNRIGNPITDYAVASKGFVFWLDFNSERSEVEKIFRSGYGVGTSLMGYSSAGDDGNLLANPQGIGSVVSELYANGSFWASFPNTTHAHAQARGHAVKAEPGKIYAHIMWSDGDNLEMDQNPLYKFWHDPARGKIPVATALSVTLQELNPPLLDWYYTNLSDNDELMAGATGLQFIYIHNYLEKLFPFWCQLSRKWSDDAGFRCCRIWLADKPSVEYGEYMATCGFDGVMGEGFSVKSGFPIGLDAWGAFSEEELFQQFLSVKPDPTKPVFTGFTCILDGFYQGDRGYSAVKRQMDRVEKLYPGRYVFMLPRDEFATIQAYYNYDVQQISAQPDSSDGLTALDEGDGKAAVVQRNGLSGWLVSKHDPPGYLYFRVEPKFQPKPGQTLELRLVYLDAGVGDIALEYDSYDAFAPWSQGGTYKRHASVIHRLNTGRWQTARFFFKDAGFGKLQNGGADFRIFNGGDDLAIHMVRISRVGP